MKPPSAAVLPKQDSNVLDPHAPPSLSGGSGRVELKSLTSLRFFAAALIVLLHFSVSSLCKQNSSLDLSGLKQGVSFFFVLSGFILRYAYPQLVRPQDSVNFVFARISRIWPSHLVALVTFALLSPVWWLPYGSKFPWISVVNLFMWQSLWQRPTVYYSLNAPSWSISTEFFFYLSFVFIIQNWSKTWKVKLLGSFLLSVCVVGLCAAAFNSGYKVGDPDFYQGWVYIGPIVRLFEFVLGMVAAELFLKKQSQFSARKIFIAEMLCLSAIAVELLLSPVLLHSTGFSSSHPLIEWLSASAGAPLFAVLIFLMASQKGLIGKALSAKPFVFLGEISFSIYLFHWTLLQVFTTRAGNLPAPLVAPAYCVCLMAISIASYRLVEIPARKYFRRVLTFSNVRNIFSTAGR